MDSAGNDRAVMDADARARAKESRWASYFAYGSNLDLEQLLARCPDATPQGAARLHGYRLAFGGYSSRRGGGVATVLPEDNGAFVQGYLYALSPQDLMRLDGFEGVPTMYRRMNVHTVTTEGREHPAVTYRLVSYQPNAPAAAYRDQIATAFQRHGFDNGLLQKALLP